MEERPDFTTYTLSELKDAERNINKEKYPDRYEDIVNLISQKKDEEPEIKVNVSGDLASRGTRLLAQIIDIIVIMIISSPLMYYGSKQGYLDFVNPENSNLVFQTLMSIFGVIVFISINIHNLKNGQTFGKKFFYIKVVNSDSTPVALKTMLAKRMLFQWGITYIPVIGGILSTIDSLFIFGKKRECVHDKVAKTKVVYV